MIIKLLHKFRKKFLDSRNVLVDVRRPNDNKSHLVFGTVYHKMLDNPMLGLTTICGESDWITRGDIAKDDIYVIRVRTNTITDALYCSNCVLIFDSMKLSIQKK